MSRSAVRCEAQDVGRGRAIRRAISQWARRNDGTLGCAFRPVWWWAVRAEDGKVRVACTSPRDEADSRPHGRVQVYFVLVRAKLEHKHHDKARP